LSLEKTRLIQDRIRNPVRSLRIIIIIMTSL